MWGLLYGTTLQKLIYHLIPSDHVSPKARYIFHVQLEICSGYLPATDVEIVKDLKNACSNSFFTDELNEV